jgi:D-alanyl-D-alanine carboxypeptidase/D-alanyl-D-alanine-endopeptidase (penicillin-binding protein 4)
MGAEVRTFPRVTGFMGAVSAKLLRTRVVAPLLICLAGGGAGFATAAAITTQPSLARSAAAAARPLVSGTVGPRTVKGGPVPLPTCVTDSTTAATSPGPAATTGTGTDTTGVCTTTSTTITPTRTAPAPITTFSGSDAPPPAAPASKALAKLQRTLDKDLNGQGGMNGGLVVDETTDQTLWDYNGAVERLPASVEKLYTTSAALLELGPEAVFQTLVFGTGKLLANGTFDGTLYLRGGGDPTFGNVAFDKAIYGTGATVQELAAHLREAGIKQVKGAIVGDESYFDSRRGGPDSHYRASLETEGELSALAYDEGFTNRLEERLQHNPPLVAAQALARALRAAHVRVDKGTRISTGVTPARAEPLSGVSSPPLSTLLALTNAPSNNFFAETLLKDLGARFGKGGTTADGAAVVRRVIADTLGLHPRLNDGSGLSRYDLTSPQQIVQLLREMQSNPYFWNSLAVAGVNGTMQDEMLHTRGVRNCRGKTGSLHDVANLVGYCRAANGDQLVFAFMMNGLTDADAGHTLEDMAGEALANYRG